jgi:hypothetical protein
MPLHLGPIDICCDAPPYSIIQACQRVGIKTPEDVRWCRMTHLDSGDFAKEEPANVRAWKYFLGMGAGSRGACSCGERLPNLEKCTFTFITGRELSYYLGQCQRCRSVYWDEA